MTSDGLSARAVSVADWAALVAARAPEPMTAARVSLGAMAFAAGVHKLLDPLSRSAYVVPWLVPVLVVSPMTFMFANGVLETGFSVAIVADRYTTPASAVAAASLSTTCLYLAVMPVVEDDLLDDVLARDIELVGLTWAVLIGSLRRSIRAP